MVADDVPTLKSGRLIYNPDSKRYEHRTPKKCRVFPKKANQIKKLLQKGKSVRFIASRLCIPKSSVQDFIKKYDLRDGLFRGSGVSEVSGKVSGVFSSKRSGKNEFEIHNYQVSVEIKDKPFGWNPNKILTFRKHNFDVIQRNGWEEYFFNFNDASVHITPYKVLIFPPKIRSRVSAVDCKVMSSQFVLDLIPKIEEFLELKLCKNKITWFDVSRQHTVLKNDKLFDAMRREGFEKVRDEGGKVRMMLDESEGEKHIESFDSSGEELIDAFSNLLEANKGKKPLNPDKTRKWISQLFESVIELKGGVKEREDVKPDPEEKGVDYFG